MYNRKELLEQFEERFLNQSTIVNNKPQDHIAYQYLSEIKKHIKGIKFTHIESKNKFLVYENIDYRIMGDDHSEVSKTPIFRCCNSCCQALQFLLRERIERNSSTYYSLGNDVGQKLNEKIVVYAGRTLMDSMDSDEMRINNEWLN